MTDSNASTIEAITVDIGSQITNSNENKTEDGRRVEIIDEQIGPTSLLCSNLPTTISESSRAISSSLRNTDKAQTNDETTRVAVLSEMESVPSAALTSEEGVPTPPPSPTARRTTVKPRSDFL